MIRGIVFDLDGTLVDSRLDFALMRAEMGLPDNQPILEALEQLAATEAERCHVILHRHELAGAERATLLPGAAELLAALAHRRIHTAIATRNSRPITAATLAKVGVTMELVLTRDEGPVKPDPWPVRRACQHWDLLPEQVLVVGDFRFDIECGRAAGCRTVLLDEDQASPHAAGGYGADLVLASLAEYPRLLKWMDTLAP